MPKTAFGLQLTALYDATALNMDPLDERITRAITVVGGALNMDTGTLGRLDGSNLVMRNIYAPGLAVEADTRVPLERTLAQVTLHTDGVLAVQDVANFPEGRGDESLARWSVRGYLGATVFRGGEPYGILGFTRNTVLPDDVVEGGTAIVAVLARWVSVELDRELADTRARAAESLFRGAFAHAGVGMAVVAADGRLLEVNDSFAAMLGHSAQELVTGGFQQLTHPDDLDSDLTLLSEVVRGLRDSYRLEKRYLHRDGSCVHANLSVSCVRNDDGQVRYLVAIIEDITSQKAYQHQLEYLAYHDPLTGLCNRRHFFQRLNELLHLAVRIDLPICVLFVDLNGFKQVNDTHGHAVGDRLLQLVAERLQSQLRKTDVLARLGGDEFGLILPKADGTAGRIVADRMLRALSEPLDVDGHLCRAHFSFGVAVATPQDGPESLVRRADAAMYESKLRSRISLR